ncbi:MAG TPA: hypothetical protein VN615_14085 [Gaiellales bacterium]|nr:hypothetical protein [Gaiellales bacterium]
MSRAGGRGLGARVTRGVRHARWTVRSRMAEHPAYLPVARRRHGEAVVSASTELVIDGFTRSASTFAVVAFQLAQLRPVRVGHHLHAPGQIIQAVRLGVPVLLTVRPPEDTVLSLVVREPYVTIPQGLHAYARFHERLLDCRDGMVVADFAEVTGRLDRLIARVNERFGTGFAAPELTPERTRAAFHLIEMRSRRPPWRAAIHDFLTGLVPYAELERRTVADPGVTAAVAEDRAARPSDHKERRKDALRADYHGRAHARLRERADVLYATFAAAAAGEPAGKSSQLM